MARGIKMQLSLPYSFIFKRKEKSEEENCLTPLTQPSPRLGRGLKSTNSRLQVLS